MGHEMKEYVFLVDKSISMYGRECEVLHTLNERMHWCKECREDSYVTLGFFSENLDMFYIHNEWECVRPINPMGYYVEGGTALYDSVCECCHRIEKNLAYIRDDILKKIEIYVISDGMDNASVNHDELSFVKEMVKRIKDGWKIQFLMSSDENIAWETICKSM